MDSFSPVPFPNSKVSSETSTSNPIIPKLEPVDETSLPENDSNSCAIVPVPNPRSHLSNAIVTPQNRKYPKRSSDLVHLMELSCEDQRYYRDIVRRTRILFESLRMFMLFQEERHGYPHKNLRADLKAATLMLDRGLCLYRDKRIVGDLPSISIGDMYFYRSELCVVGLHGQPQAGIDYVPASQSVIGEPIATSIVVLGGYEDNRDDGDVIIYTGHGGKNKKNRQVMDQKLERGNLALKMSMEYGVEVRVIRGFRHRSIAGGRAYIYDGLYKVTKTWSDVGRSGFRIYKFRLVRNENQVSVGSSMTRLAQSLRTWPLEVRPNSYVTLDLSKSEENVPVLLFNDIDQDHDPINYDYLVSTVFPSHVYNCRNNTGCECEGGCSNNCSCVMKNGGEFAYDQHGVLFRGKPLIFECGPNCRCLPTCRNRVTQKGVRNQFEVFRSTETNWGVRSLDLIQAGSFIFEYAGVVLTQEQAQILTMSGENLIYPGRFAERWREWGDLSQIFSDYACPADPSIPSLDFAMDVSKKRNIACYLAHSSTPNVFMQLVLYDHSNVLFPHLMLFAMENIPPMRELCLDYGA